MPKYDYECSNDKNVYEFELPFNHQIPTCLCGIAMKRVYLPPAIIFKGSGFYKNDSK